MYDVAVLGLGKTGLAVLEYLIRAEPGKKILASEAKADSKSQADWRRKFPGVTFEFGGHGGIAQSRLIIKSPGIDPKLEALGKARESGAQVMSELEFALPRLGKRPQVIIGVTGTNGKTTASHLLGHLFRQAGRPVTVAGNIGEPLIAQAGRIQEGQVLVLEISSYQLDDSGQLGLGAAILMNITPDHLDHHGGWEGYVRAKEKIFSFVRRGGLDIINFEDLQARRAPRGAASRRLFFSSARSLKEGAWIERGRIHLEWSGAAGAYILDPCPNLIGNHNLDNQMAAGLAGAFFGLTPTQINSALAGYKPPPHRLEQLGEIHGVLVINDSKATNVDSVVVALKATQEIARRRGGRIHLLVGGQDKGAPYRPILEAGAGVGACYVYGQARDKIISELGSQVKCLQEETLEGALDLALKSAKSGDIVLLSPACASFDQFRDYEHRGETFRKLTLARKSA